jgi:hypothetical protein
MATRMQQRRGTAAQWVSVNGGDGPILEAGEIGFETDTGKFKIGDGTNHWIDLDYFVDANSTVNPSFGSSITFEGSTSNDFETTIQVTDPTADRTITFPDASGTVALTSDISELSQDAIDAALVAGTGLDKTYNDGSNTITLDIDSTVTTNSGSQTLTNKTIALGSNTVSGTLAEFNTAVTDADLASLAGAETLSNKTISLGSNTVSGTLAQFNTAVTDADLASLAGAETLTNKTLALGSNTVSGTLAEFNSAVTDADLASIAGAETLTNKTISLASNTVSGTTAEFNTALTDANFVTTGDTGTVTSTMIADGTIVDGDINASAAISYSKLNLAGSITSSDIANGAIVNDDINASANIALSKLATDPLARTNHTGTQTASTISDFDTQVRTSRLDQMAAPTASVSLNSQKITSLATPVDATDAATKAYVDAVTEGLHIHEAARAAVLTNIAIATALENGDSAGGVTLATGDRILVNGQTTTSENGIYVVQASGQALRATDFDTATEVDSGDFIFVTSGTYANTGWVQTLKPATIGTDPISFTQFSGAGTFTAGNGLTLTGNSFSINTSITADLSTAQTLTNKTISAASNTLTIAPTDLTGVTASAAEINVLDGITSSTAELNILDGVTASASELNILDGATLSTTELNYVDGVTSAIQTQIDGKISASSSDTLTNKTIALGSNTVSGTLAQFNSAVTDADLASLAGSETLTNKTIALGSNTVSGTLAQFNTAVTDADLASLAGAETLTNKTIALGSNTISGTIAQFNTAVTDADLATLAGVETLTNKTVNLTSNTLTGTIAQFNTALSDADFATLAGTETLTNKTLTSPVINAGTNNQTGTTYTLALTDNGKIVTLNNASAITLTVPTNSSVGFPVGSQIFLTQLGAGQVTATSSATLRATPGAKLRTTYSSAALIKIDTDTWVLSGDIVA